MCLAVTGSKAFGVMAVLVALATSLVLYRARAPIGKAMEKHITLPFRSVIGSREHVTTLIGVTTNVCFLGTAVGSLLGYTGDSREAYLMGALLALLCAWLLVRLSGLSAELAKAEVSASHRRTAGAVRSIVRDEIDAARVRAAAARRNRTGRCSYCGAPADGIQSLKRKERSSRMKGNQ